MENEDTILIKSFINPTIPYRDKGRGNKVKPVPR
jgi:hypothetical protein